MKNMKLMNILVLGSIFGIFLGIVLSALSRVEVSKKPVGNAEVVQKIYLQEQYFHNSHDGSTPHMRPEDYRMVVRSEYYSGVVHVNDAIWAKYDEGDSVPIEEVTYYFGNKGIKIVDKK